MVRAVNFEWGCAERVSSHRDRRSVRIGTGDHEHISSAHAVIARANIRWQIGTSQVADVNIGVRVRPGNSNKHIFSHSPSSG